MTILENIIQTIYGDTLTKPGSAFGKTDSRGSLPLSKAMLNPADILNNRGSLSISDILDATVQKDGEILLKGEIRDIRMNSITLVLDSGEEFTAKTEGLLPFSIGDNAKFVLASHDDKHIYLRPYQTSEPTFGAMDNIAEKALEGAGLPYTERNMEIAKTLLKHGLPVTKNELQKAVMTAAKKPDLPVREALLPGVSVIPIQLKENESKGELYVYRKKRDSGSSDSSSVFLRFDLETLGRTEILVRLTGNLLSVSMKVSSEKAREVFTEEMEEFSEHMQAQGFSVNSSIDVFDDKKENESLLSRFLDSHSPSDNQRFSFDVRA